MNNQSQSTQRKEGLLRAARPANLRRVASTSLVAAALSVAFLGSSNAQAIDSFFDVFTELSVSGQVNMSPVDSGAFPFPPPPLNFPNISAGTSSPVDIELVSLSLISSGPMTVGRPDATGSFQVDSFFDIEYELHVTDDMGTPTPIFDSFFDVSYSMLVSPLEPVIHPDGSETRQYDTEILAMDLSASNPVSLPGEPSFGLGLSITPAPSAGQKHHGHVTILKIAGGGGDFNVDSFFDVFVELSINGGPPIASTEDSPLRLLSSNPGVPEPASLTLLGLGAMALLRRRRV